MDRSSDIMDILEISGVESKKSELMNSDGTKKVVCSVPVLPLVFCLGSE